MNSPVKQKLLSMEEFKLVMKCHFTIVGCSEAVVSTLFIDFSLQHRFREMFREVATRNL